jgi:hypothetical protein
MIITYLIMKLTLQAVVDECNRIAAEEESHERARYLKSRIAQLDIDYANGAITEAEYSSKGSEILNELALLSTQRGVVPGE